MSLVCVSGKLTFLQNVLIAIQIPHFNFTESVEMVWNIFMAYHHRCPIHWNHVEMKVKDSNLRPCQMLPKLDQRRSWKRSFSATQELKYFVVNQNKIRLSKKETAVWIESFSQRTKTQSIRREKARFSTTQKQKHNLWFAFFVLPQQIFMLLDNLKQETKKEICALICFAFFGTNLTSAQVSLPPQTMNKHVHQQAPKAWLNYIRAFLVERLKNEWKTSKYLACDQDSLQSQLSCRTLEYELQSWFVACRDFKTVSCTTIVEVDTKWGISGSDNCRVIPTCVNNTEVQVIQESDLTAFYQIQRPTFTLFVNRFNEVERKPGFCMFQLCDQLMLDIHINSIDTGPDSFSPEGDLTTRIRVDGKCLALVSRNVWFANGTEVFFCGKYSGGHVFMSFHVFKLLLPQASLVHLDLSFSVWDSRIIRQHLKPYHLQCLDWHIEFIASKVSILKYLFSGQKYEFIKLYILRDQDKRDIFDEISVYDGPEIMHKSLKSSSNVYETMAFQCTTLVTLKDSFIEKAGLYAIHHSFQMHYSKHKLNNVHILGETEFYFSSFKSNFLIQRVQLSVGTIGKVRLNYLQTSGRQCATCRFAGLSMFDFVEPGYNEFSTVCDSSINTYQFFEIHSLSNEMLLVFYAYEAFAHLKISLSVSQSQCSSKRINICQFSYFPNVHRGRYVGDFLPTSDENGQINIPLLNTNCVVVLVTDQDKKYVDINGMNYCRVHVKPQSDSTHFSILQYNVQGFLQTLLHFSSNRTSGVKKTLIFWVSHCSFSESCWIPVFR